MQKFAVIGMGRFGHGLAKALAVSGAEVIAIDRDATLIERVRDEVTLAVRLERTAEGLALTVEDDGRGMEAGGGQLSETEPEEQLGVRGMQERAGLIGGHLEITSRPGQGTRVYLTVPL